MKKLLSTVLMILIVPQAAWSMGLEELMAKAVGNRDLVKTFFADLEKSREDVKFAKGNFYPSLDVGYTANRLGSDGAFENKENNALFGTATLNVFNGFKDMNDLRASETLTEVTALRLAAIKEDIRLSAALDFLAVKRNIANLRVSEDEVNLFKERYENIRLRQKVGLLKKNDLLKIKVEMDNAVQKMKSTRATLEKSVNELAFTVGTKVSRETLDFAVFEKLPETKGYAAYETELLDRRSELAALRKRGEAAGFLVESARAPLYPKADLSLGYIHGEEDYLPGLGRGDENETRLSLKVTMNLFDGYQKQTGISKARLDVKRVGYELSELTEAFKKALRNILLDIDVAGENLAVAESSRLEAEENLRVTELSFGRGLATSADILDAIFFLSRSKFNVIDARNEIFRNNFRLTRMIEGFTKTGASEVPDDQ